MSNEIRSETTGPFITADARYDILGRIGESYRANLADGDSENRVIRADQEKDDKDDHKVHKESKDEFDSKNRADRKADKHEEKEFHPDKGAAGHDFRVQPDAGYEAQTGELLDRTVIV